MRQAGGQKMWVRCNRGKLLLWVALSTVVLCWLYIFPGHRFSHEKNIVAEVLEQGEVWQKNQTGIDLYRKLLTECCDPGRMFAVTKENSPLGKVLWFDGEFYSWHTVNKETHALFVQHNPLKLPLKKCAIVGNGGILRNSNCGRDIDKADFIMRCNLPPLSKEYVKDVGTRTHLVTVNPSIIRESFKQEKLKCAIAGNGGILRNSNCGRDIDKADVIMRFQSLLWSRKAFVDSMKVYGSSYVYMPAFTTNSGTDPSLRTYYALADTSSNLTMLFANPEFLLNMGKFWKARSVHARRLSTGLYLVGLALGLCEEVTIYGFWPFSVGLDKQPVSHHYYDNVMPYTLLHAMPEEFVQLWQLHKSGMLRMRVGRCPSQEGGS